MPEGSRTDPGEGMPFCRAGLGREQEGYEAMRKILVVGAGGFIGGHLARYLAGLDDTTVVAAVRPGGSPAPEGPGLEAATVDLRNAASLRAACDGVDAIVNCAVGDRWVTVNGTQAILNAARDFGIRRVVHLSSTAVYGTQKGAVTEDTPIMRPFGAGYPSMKAEADLLCQAAAAGGVAPSVVVLRPTVVMGPGSTVWAGLIARRLASRRWGTLGWAGEGTCNLVDVADLVQAIAAAIDCPCKGVEAFNIAGPETLTWNSFFAKYNDALDLPTVRELKPDVLGLRIMTRDPQRWLARKIPPLRKKVAPTLLGTPTFVELDLYRFVVTYPADKARRLLNWTPAVGVDASLAGAASWVKAQGFTTV